MVIVGPALTSRRVLSSEDLYRNKASLSAWDADADSLHAANMALSRYNHTFNEKIELELELEVESAGLRFVILGHFIAIWIVVHVMKLPNCGTYHAI